MNLVFRSFLLLISFVINTGVDAHTGVNAQDIKPDTVRVGIYITSIHDIDFKQKEYTANLWVWLQYKNKEFDFL